jgi:hypothetical protein
VYRIPFLAFIPDTNGYFIFIGMVILILTLLTTERAMPAAFSLSGI